MNINVLRKSWDRSPYSAELKILHARRLSSEVHMSPKTHWNFLFNESIGPIIPVDFQF